MKISSFRKENSNEYVIMIDGLDFDAKDRIVAVLETVSKSRPEYYKNRVEIEEENLEGLPQVGDQNLIQAGRYKGMTISEGFFADGYGFISSVIQEDCLKGNDFIVAMRVVFEAEQFLMQRIANGLLEAELNPAEMRETFGWLAGNDFGVDKLTRALTEYAKDVFDIEGMIYNAPMCKELPQTEFNGMNVVEVYQKYGLNGLSELLKISRTDKSVFDYAKALTAAILRHPKLVDTAQFFEAFGSFFKEIRLEDVRQMEEEARKELYTKKSMELIKRMAS